MPGPARAALPSPAPGRAGLTALTPQNSAAWHNFPNNGRSFRWLLSTGAAAELNPKTLLNWKLV